jgi:hypothetical protein
MGEGQSLSRTLGWSTDFPRVSGEPSKECSVFERVVSRPLMSIYCEHFWVCIKSLKCIKGLFE